MNKNDIVDYVYDALATYRKHFGHHEDPGFICLTKELEKALIKLSEDDHYMLGIKFQHEKSSFSSENLKDELESFMGLQVKWDSKSLEFLNKNEEQVPSSVWSNEERLRLLRTLAEDKKRKDQIRRLR